MDFRYKRSGMYIIIDKGNSNIMAAQDAGLFDDPEQHLTPGDLPFNSFKFFGLIASQEFDDVAIRTIRPDPDNRTQGKAIRPSRWDHFIDHCFRFREHIRIVGIQTETMVT